MGHKRCNGLHAFFLTRCKLSNLLISISSASEKHITALSMEPGDVLLVDNYRALHGRDVFQGDRYHAVSWFTWDTNEEWRGNERRIVEKNGLNKVINQMMDWLPKDFESKQN
jgi:alpha-ketoglutarate-dependent taurine dioxygenase